MKCLLSGHQPVRHEARTTNGVEVITFCAVCSVRLYNEAPQFERPQALPMRRCIEVKAP